MAQPPTGVIVGPAHNLNAHATPTHAANGQVRDDEGIGTLIHRAVDNARELAQAEIALVKAKISERVGAYQSAVVFFAIAGVLALAALIALLVGLIMTIATLVGPGWATLIVVGATLVVAAVLGLIGKGKLAPVKVKA